MVLHEKYAKEPWRHIGLKVPHFEGSFQFGEACHFSATSWVEPNSFSRLLLDHTPIPLEWILRNAFRPSKYLEHSMYRASLHKAPSKRHCLKH